MKVEIKIISSKKIEIIVNGITIISVVDTNEQTEPTFSEPRVHA